MRLLFAVLTALAIAASLPVFAAPARAAIDPCALVTQAEASAAMGVAALAPIRHSNSHGSSCRYYSPDRTKNVFVQTIPAAELAGVVQLGAKPLPGIGDKAYWTSGSIFLSKGANAVQVGLYLSADSMTKMDAAEPGLAKKAASRM